ncbi:phenylalanine--tRNA ligase subunit alpha [Blochmannia endosymbiont of Colobopsis nipponica]|uniref:phenylalanine--tRNA ligase subunit alpha n=1 Tax=Blochmannia endosymbiont of Colobopsis nipponica TaxID=2681987 RepID=UPI001784719B|nr:phenylalanine--tRNA ligase subunit alpha [Blochmannia endosymbiont of Colobopsis nipponica]QOI11090.1 phenylalanine--tRNA ligase subunit alpha [Blochmannia endosymbiont of Colobopsis nipponica]
MVIQQKIKKSNLQDLIKQAEQSIQQSHNLSALESVRIAFLGKNGYINQQIVLMRNLNSIQKAEIGNIINNVKKTIKKLLYIRKNILESILIQERLLKEKIDISLPGRKKTKGRLHPLTLTNIKIKNFFEKLNFTIVEGPEIEDDYHNFSALNIPVHHPSRTEQDTFWLDDTRLLRTQTSGIQIRVMKSQKPPIRIITYGRVYRKDYDKTHTPMFHQIEGLMIDNYSKFTDLKGILYDFLNYFFTKNIKIRFRPSYFPFTEPSAEIDITREKDHWLEILGCGMVHPSILQNMNIDSEKFSGFAFGMGVERLTMLNYNVTDLRTFFKNDIRFLQQFK